MRNVNPADMEQLSSLFQGRNGISYRLDEAFSRASHLGVSSSIAALRPLQTWVNEAAPDIRKRAAIARLENGDPQAGLRWAGFTTADIEKYRGDGLTADTLLLANSVAASDDPAADIFQRKPYEPISDWLVRLEAHALAEIPGLGPHEQTLAKILEYSGEWFTAVAAATVFTVYGSSLTTVLAGNTIKQGALRSWKLRIAVALRGSNNNLLRQAGTRLVGWSPVIRSLSAPGSWLPGQIWGLASRSSVLQQVGGVPLTSGLRGDLIGRGWDALRTAEILDTPAAYGLTANRTANFLLGSDALARMYGGFSHSGQPIIRAANANLWTVFKKARNVQHFANSLPNSTNAVSGLKAGLSTAGKTAGLLRGAGVIGGVISTVFSAIDVVSQGWPHEAFQRKGAGYVADVAELGFNASLTWAMNSPSPWSVGTTAVFGGIYLGAKGVQHWERIHDGAVDTVDWVGNKAEDFGDGVAGSAKAVAKSKANPMNWF